MNQKNLTPIAFIAAHVFSIAAIVMIFNRLPGTSIAMLLALISHITFLVLSIREISNSNNIKNNDKGLWYFGLIFFTTVVGLIYILTKRSNPNNQNQLTQN